MIILLEATNYYSQSAEDYESDIKGIFRDENELNKFLKENNITEEQFDRYKWFGEDDFNRDCAWYYTRKGDYTYDK